MPRQLTAPPFPPAFLPTLPLPAGASPQPALRARGARPMPRVTARRARQPLFMLADATPSEEPPSGGGDDDAPGDAQDSEWASEQNVDADAKADPEADAQSSSPSPDVHLDMNLLRRRMAELDASPPEQFRVSGSHGTPDGENNSVIDISIAMRVDGPSDIDSTFLRSFDAIKTLWVILFTATSDGTEGVYSLSVGEESIVLAFQQRDEAQRYALSLEAQDFPVPQLCEMESAQLKEFCEDAGFRLGFVPAGSLISPPDESAIDDIDKWRGDSSSYGRRDSTTGMSQEDIDAMKKKLDSLFGQ